MCLRSAYGAYEVLMRTQHPTPREARQRAKLTQLEVAVRAELNPATVYRIEAANRWPTRQTTLRRLRAALGLKP